MTKCCPSFWSLECRDGLGCMCVWFLHLTAQCSCKPLLMYEVVLCLQNPFPDDMKVKTAFTTSQDDILQEQSSLLLNHLQLKTWYEKLWHLSWAIITAGSPRECDGDTAACTSCLWWAAMQMCLSTPLAASLLLRVTTGAHPRARQSSLGIPQLVVGRQRNAVISYWINFCLQLWKRGNAALNVWGRKWANRSQTLISQVDFTCFAYLPVLNAIALDLQS